jgi:iron complex outermembrane receptor protein
MAGSVTGEGNLQHKVRLLASSALLVAVTAFGPTAYAQSRSGTTAAASNTIEELVVTAEKRAQSLQDVPVAISAFTSANRDLIGINTIQDMTNFTPGLNYTSANDRASIRGVGRLTNAHPVAVPVAVYDDGIYTTSTVLAGKSPIFTDRVEVLRGPQGTLYGRNSLGGAINVISRHPTEEFYAEVRATVANYKRTLLEAAMSGPLAPDLQFRLAGSWEKQRDGYFKNVVPGMPTEGNVIDQFYVEGQLQAKFGEHMDGWMKVALLGWNNGAGGPGARSGYSPGPINFNEFSGQNVNAGFACAPGGVVTNVVNASPLGCTNPAASDPRKFASLTKQTVSLDDTYIISGNLTYHFDNFDVKYVVGGNNYHYSLFQDNDGAAAFQSFVIKAAPFNPLLAGNPATTQPCPATNAAGGSCPGFNVFPQKTSTYQEEYNNISHEIDFSSNGNGPFQWLAGLYYYREAYRQPVFTTEPQQPQLGPTAAIFVNPALASVSGPALGTDFQNRLFDNRTSFENDSYAAFGQIDWKFADHWKLTVGLRYNHDHLAGQEDVRLLCIETTPCGFAPELWGNFAPAIDITASQAYGGVASLSGTAVTPPGVVVDGHPNTAGVTFTPDGFGHRKYDISSTATTGVLGLQWQPDKDTMVYARYGRGYLQGGINSGVTSSLGQFPFTGPEFINNYEIGLKKDFGRTLQTNIAIFYYDFRDFQVPLTVANLTGQIAVSQSRYVNVPKSVSEGIELEATWAPIDNLRVLFNYSFNPSRIDQLTNIIDPADPEALQPGAKPVAAGAVQTCTGTGSTPSSANPNPNPLCDVATGLVQRPQNLHGNALPQQPRNKIAVNVLYTFDFEKGSLTPSASYVWRDKEYSGIFERDYYASRSWSQVDARVTWKDKDNKYSVIAYVKNLGDSLAYDGGSGASRLSGSYPNAVIAASQGTALPVTPGLAGGLPNTAGGLNTNGVLCAAGCANVRAGGIATSYALAPPRTYGIEFQYRF